MLFFKRYFKLLVLGWFLFRYFSICFHFCKLEVQVDVLVDVLTNVDGSMNRYSGKHLITQRKFQPLGLWEFSRNWSRHIQIKLRSENWVRVWIRSERRGWMEKKKWEKGGKETLGSTCNHRWNEDESPWGRPKREG